MKIAYQGEPGAFSEAAARRSTPTRSCCRAGASRRCSTPSQAGTAAYGVLPIENSIGGSIHRNYDLLLEHELPIVGEVELPVVHHLLALPGATLDDLRRVYSHPQALAQCERFLRTLTGVEIIATYDTAGSAKMVADDGLTDAGGDRLGARRRGVRPDVARRLGPGLRRQHHALPRRRPARRCRTAVADKTSIVFSLPNEPGSLFKALSVFALRGIDLTKLESRPIPGRPWEYLFYVDLAAGARRGPCARALAHLAEFAPMLRTLGTYAELEDARGLQPDPFEVMS